MPTYRERREARAERLRGWAATREQRASAQLSSQPELRHDWAFITQPGHIPERARMNARDGRAFESLDKAASMSARADEIERQAAGAIYSDDADAIPQLRAKLARLEAERKRWTDYNAACRKAGKATAEALALLDSAQRADLAETARVVAWQIRANGAAPAYLTANLGGNISRLRARLEALEHPRPTWFHASRRDPGTCYKCDRPESDHTPHERVASVLMCPTVPQ